MSLQPYDPPVAPAPRVDIDLAQWAQDAADVHRMADALARTSFVPAALQGRPDEIAAQILYGREVNMSPMIALQQIHIIERRPSISALAMRGLAQSNGVKFRVDEMTETRCKMSAIAPGDAQWTTVSWTIDRAKKLGLTAKSNWTKQPQAMLIARATSELCRLVAAPLFLGMAYSTEELRDGEQLIDDEEPQTAQEPPRKANTRAMKRTPIKAPPAHLGDPAPEPDPPSEPEVDEDAEDKELHRLRMTLWSRLGLLGLPGRTDRLGFISDFLKREVNTPSHLPREDLLELIAEVDKQLPQTPPADE